MGFVCSLCNVVVIVNRISVSADEQIAEFLISSSNVSRMSIFYKRAFRILLPIPITAKVAQMLKRQTSIQMSIALTYDTLGNEDWAPIDNVTTVSNSSISMATYKVRTSCIMPK